MKLNLRVCLPALLALALASCVAPPVPNDASRWTLEIGSSDARPSGSCRILDEANRLMLEGSLVAGEMDGTWTAWGSQGDRLAVWSYRAGERNGPVQMWYGPLAYPEARGRLKLEGNFIEGKFDGTVTRNHESGGRRSVRIYERGTLKSARSWSPAGTEQPPDFTAHLAADEEKGDLAYFAAMEDIVTRSVSQARRRIQ